MDIDESNLFITRFTDEFEKLTHTDTIVSLLDFEHDYYFLNKIEEINIIMGQKQLENIITTLNIISSRNNHDKIDLLKKINVQKCISWCEKYDIPCIKLLSSSNIFVSGIYDDNSVSIHSSSSNNNSFKRNTFLKNKNYTHKNNTNRKSETSNACSNDTNTIVSKENIISSIVDDIIESVSIIGENTKVVDCSLLEY